MTEKVKITFLGTASAIPTATRNHTSIWLSYRDENIMVDCGEGTQRQLKMAGISANKITKLLISHWHGDHVLGIPGLLQTLAFNDYNKTLKIYGPPGTKKYMQEMLNVFVFFGKIKFEVYEINKPGVFFDNGDFMLESERLFHGTPCNAYNFVKKGVLRIDKKKLKKFKISEGPHLGSLKKGKDIIYNGKKFKAKDLTYNEDGKKISFVLDTSTQKNIPTFVKNADALIIESNFGPDMEEKAKEYHHMTSKQAAEIGKKAQVGRVFLTHISQRYDNNPEHILNEARKTFKKTYLAKDLEVVEI